MLEENIIGTLYMHVTASHGELSTVHANQVPHQDKLPALPEPQFTFQQCDMFQIINKYIIYQSDYLHFTQMISSGWLLSFLVWQTYSLHFWHSTKQLEQVFLKQQEQCLMLEEESQMQHEFWITFEER